MLAGKLIDTVPCLSFQSTKAYVSCLCFEDLSNLFVPNAPFLYPLKTSENLTVF